MGLRGHQCHRWTPGEDEIVRRDYTGTRDSMARIASNLGLRPGQVRGRVYNLGLCKKMDRGKPWTLGQDDKLRKLIPRYSIHIISKRMNRTVNSIVIRAKRLGLTRRSHEGWYTLSEVCEIFGMDHHWVRRRIDSGALQATYHNGHKPTNNGQNMWHITERALKRFMRRYPQDLEGRNVDMIAIVEILAGIEPEPRGRQE